MATPTRCSLNPAWDQINTYGNDGRSEYYAAVLGVNGTFGAGHVVTSSITWTDKKNISDDFSPVFPFGYPSDPADIDAEFARSRGAEDIRVVLSGIFRLPANFNIGATYIYGTGLPWNPIYGYDYNGDGKNSDRVPGCGTQQHGRAAVLASSTCGCRGPWGSRAARDSSSSPRPSTSSTRSTTT